MKPSSKQLAIWVMDYIEEKFDHRQEHFTESDLHRYTEAAAICQDSGKIKPTRGDIIMYFETQESLPYS